MILQNLVVCHPEPWIVVRLTIPFKVKIIQISSLTSQISNEEIGTFCDDTDFGTKNPLIGHFKSKVDKKKKKQDHAQEKFGVRERTEHCELLENAKKWFS